MGDTVVAGFTLALVSDAGLRGLGVDLRAAASSSLGDVRRANKRLMDMTIDAGAVAARAKAQRRRSRVGEGELGGRDRLQRERAGRHVDPGETDAVDA